MNDMVEAVDNPFRDAPVAARPQASETVMSSSQSAREVAEVQTAMVMARRFPRNEMAVVDSILQACTRPTLAEGALYEYARGGTDIRGPSIRLAECLAQHWGHLDFGARVLETRPDSTKVQTYAWDLQTGTRAQWVFDVMHERIAGGSRKILSDPRDILEHIANAASRRLRSCILRVIPGDVVEAAVKQCEVTMKTRVEVTPERLKSMVDQFAELGVSKAAIEKRIQRRIEAITPGLMVQLGKIFTSLRDNMSLPGDWFDLTAGAPQGAQEPAGDTQPKAAPTTARQAVKERIAARKRPEPPADTDVQPTPAPQPEQASASPQPPPNPEAAPPQYSDAFFDVVHFSKAAANKADLERAAAVATKLTDPDEALLAQQHLDAARRRIEP